MLTLHSTFSLVNPDLARAARHGTVDADSNGTARSSAHTTHKGKRSRMPLMETLLTTDGDLQMDPASPNGDLDLPHPEPACSPP